MRDAIFGWIRVIGMVVLVPVSILHLFVASAGYIVFHAGLRAYSGEDPGWNPPAWVEPGYPFEAWISFTLRMQHGR